MAEEKNSNTILPISGLIVLLAALGITVFNQAPFRGARPAVPEIRGSCEKVDARLWQDPFSAVLEHLKSIGITAIPENIEEINIYSTTKKQASFAKGNSPTGEGSLVGELKERIQNEKGKITVLGVMVFGSRNEEETEQRTRNRYAVLSGLSRVGFVPEDPEHLAFVSMSHRSRPDENRVTLSNILPFEWLKSSKNENDAVLLLWMNDQIFTDKPLFKLSQLVDCLGLGGKLNGRVNFKVIGPAGSTTLKNMLEEVNPENPGYCKQNSTGQTDNLKHGVEIYSPFATVDDSILLHHACLADAGRHDTEDMFNNFGIKFVRTIGTDSELANKLIEELSLRRVTPAMDKHHILLVAEWDTDYGRSLPEIFTTVLKEKAVSSKEEVKQRVHTVSYMRGIDGRLPGEKEDKEEEKRDAKSKPGDEIKKLEQPTGKSQMDYLRRLSEEAKKLDQDLIVNDKGSIKAIGVLGSDFYDKYLVIQALRQQFPEAVYFTTDLDARFFHPDKFKLTHNLLVASNFDLALREDLQGGVPPFRDNYQTSIFYATLRAFASYLNPGEEKILATNKRTPQIFEIGRYGAINLDNPKDTLNPMHQIKNRQILFVAHAFIILVLLAILLLFTSVRAREYAEDVMNQDNTPKFGRFMAITGVAVAVVFALYVLYLCQIKYDEEVFSFFNGTSSWPSELIRMISSLTAIFFLIKASKDLKKNRILITTDYFDKDLSEIPNIVGFSGIIKHITSKFNSNKGLPRIVEMMKEYWQSVKFDWEDNNTKDIFSLWSEYVRRDSNKYRIMRMLSVLILFFILCFSIFFFSGFPMKPIRGIISYNCDSFILFLSVLSFIILVFYVFDVTLICRQFITKASGKKPIWSKEAIQAFVSKGILEREEAIQNASEPSWSELRLVQMIAERTEAVGKLIYYPFIVWFILFVARINYFDNWPTPLGLTLVICLSAVYAWSCAFFLRRAAENARSDSIRRLVRYLQQVHFTDKPNEKQKMRIRFTINEIKSIREGAFLPFMQHPLVKTLFVPFGGTGLVYLFDFLQK